MSDTKHGWVTPRADGARARCGGPPVCATCNTEALHEAMLTGFFGVVPTATPSWLDGGADAVEMARQDGLLGAPTSHPIPTGATGEDGEKPYCYALETRGRHAGIDDVLLDVEYNGTDNFSGGRTGGIPLYRRPAPAAGDALYAARYRWMRDIARDEQCQEDGAIYARQVQFTSRIMTGSGVLTEDDLDTAIDAAIAQQKGEA